MICLCMPPLWFFVTVLLCYITSMLIEEETLYCCNSLLKLHKISILQFILPKYSILLTSPMCFIGKQCFKLHRFDPLLLVSNCAAFLPLFSHIFFIAVSESIQAVLLFGGYNVTQTCGYSQNENILQVKTL